MPLPTSNNGHGAPRERDLERRQQHWSTVLSEGSPSPTPKPVEPHQPPPSDSAALAATPAQPSHPRHAEPRQPQPGPLLPPLLPDNARHPSLPTETTAQPRVTKLASFDALLAVAKEQHMHFAAEKPASETPPEVARQQLEQPLFPPLRSLLSSSSASADTPAETAEIRALASRRLHQGASLRPFLSVAAAAGPPPVRASSAWLARAHPPLPEAHSRRPDVSPGIEVHLPAVASAPLASLAHDMPTASRGPDYRAVGLPLPRLAGLPVSPPVPGGSLLRNRIVQEPTWTPSGHHRDLNPASSMAAVTPSPMPERLSDEKVPIGAANMAFGVTGFSARRSQLPSLYFQPKERTPSAALSLLAETSDEQPPLKPRRKRSRDSPTIPLRDSHEIPVASELHRKAAPRVLREISASSHRLNPPEAKLPMPLDTLQPMKTATSDLAPIAGSLLPPLAYEPLGDVLEERKYENQPGAIAAGRFPPLAESALPSTGLQESQGETVDAAHASPNPLLAPEMASQLGPLSASSNRPLLQSERIATRGNDRAAFHGSQPATKLPPPVVQVHGHMGLFSALPANPAEGQEAVPPTPQGLSSGPTHSTRPVASGSPVAQSALEPETPKDEAQVSWLCDRCGRPYKWKQTLQAHRRLCGMKTFACDECSERFDTRPPLETHKRNAHEKRAKRHFCHCGLSYENKSNLRRHERETHEQHAPAVCNRCGKSYPRKTSLHRHIMEKHMGEKRREDRSKQEKKEKRDKEGENRRDP